MASPFPNRYQHNTGRRGEGVFTVQWTQTDSDNLENEIVLSQDDLPGHYESERYGVEHIEWTSALNVSADIEFNSTPMSPRGLILTIPPDATAGEFDFTKHPMGCLSEPNRDSPGDVVITTRGALPGDELTIRARYRVKGKSKPSGVLTA